MCPYFDDLDKIFGKNPNINPEHVQTSKFSDTSSSSGSDTDTDNDSSKNPTSKKDSSRKRKNSVAKSKNSSSLTDTLQDIHVEKLDMMKYQVDRKYDLLETKKKNKYDIKSRTLTLQEREMAYKEECLKLKALGVTLSIE